MPWVTAGKTVGDELQVEPPAGNESTAAQFEAAMQAVKAILAAIQTTDGEKYTFSLSGHVAEEGHEEQESPALDYVSVSVHRAPAVSPVH